MWYMGIDQSYSHSGVVILNDDGSIQNVYSIMTSNDFLKFYPNHILDFKKTKAYEIGLIDDDCKLTKKKKDITKPEIELLKISYQDRFSFTTQTLHSIIHDLPQPITAGIENISLFSKGAVVDLARLLGAIEHTLQINGIEHQLFPPTAVKKFARKGNATKDEMISYVPEEDLEILKSYCPTDKTDKLIGLDNLVDAYWIAKLTYSTYQH